MTEKIYIGVAWPYANGSLHIGQIAGACLPADIFARYHRTKGNEVVMVSGSDQHGTPITIKAEQEGKIPEEIADYYQKEYLDCWEKLGISFDLDTSTGTANHANRTGGTLRSSGITSRSGGAQAFGRGQRTDRISPGHAGPYHGYRGGPGYRFHQARGNTLHS